MTRAIASRETKRLQILRQLLVRPQQVVELLAASEAAVSAVRAGLRVRENDGPIGFDQNSVPSANRQKLLFRHVAMLHANQSQN